MRGAATTTDAIGQLFDQHWRDAWRVANGIVRSRQIADEVAQDAFLAAMQSLGQFDGRRPFGAWLHRIVKLRTDLGIPSRASIRWIVADLRRERLMPRTMSDR